MISPQYGYLIGVTEVMIIWTVLFILRKDLHKEMLFMSILMGVGSVITAYAWWTLDWWHPLTITGTRVGIEDLAIGFAAGGVMAVIYEEVAKKKFSRQSVKKTYPGGLTIILLIVFITSFLFRHYATSFISSTIAMIVASATMLYFRKDLFYDGLWSGILMTLISLPIYWTIIILSPQWVDVTYYKNIFSDIRITGIPIEELIFWFFAGMVFGPLYEYTKGFKLRPFHT